jgi:hypothetical protein
MQAECVMLCAVEVLTFSGAVKSKARKRQKHRSGYEKRCRAARHVPTLHGEMERAVTPCARESHCPWAVTGSRTRPLSRL